MPLSIFLEKASGIVFVVLGGLLSYQLALFTWSLLPMQEVKYHWVAPKAQVTSNKNDIKNLQQYHLFGDALSSEKIVNKRVLVSDAPKTTLNLTLVGVVAATDPRFSSAIISYNSKQDSYFIDSKIEGTGARVSEIDPDRIILDVDGILQTLMLDGVEKIKQLQEENKGETVHDKIIEEKVKRVELDRTALLKDPQTLSNYIRISPYRRDGKMLGYRVQPGKDRTLFDQAGLQNDDLAIELNGVDLTDTQQAFSLMKDFPTMTEISLTVERNGQLYQLDLNIP